MIFLLYGPDSFRAHAKVVAIRDKFFSSQPSFNLTEVVGSELKTSDEILRIVGSPTLLGGKRLLIITNCLSSAPVNIKDALVTTIKQGLPDDLTILFYESLDFDKRQSLFKLLNQPKTAQYFDLLTGVQLQAYASELARAKSLTIDDLLLRRVVSLVGNDLWRLNSELTKLSAYAVTRPLSVEAVQSLVSANLADNLFALMDAIANHNPAGANRLLAELIQGGEDPIGLMAILAFQLRNLILIKSLSEHGKPVGEIIKLTSLHPYAVSSSLKQTSRFTTDQLVGLYQRLVTLDWKIKRGELMPADALDHFLVTTA